MLLEFGILGKFTSTKLNFDTRTMEIISATR